MLERSPHVILVRRLLLRGAGWTVMSDALPQHRRVENIKGSPKSVKFEDARCLKVGRARLSNETISVNHGRGY
jgi:hypothetical protein